MVRNKCYYLKLIEEWIFHNFHPRKVFWLLGRNHGWSELCSWIQILSCPPSKPPACSPCGYSYSRGNIHYFTLQMCSQCISLFASRNKAVTSVKTKPTILIRHFKEQLEGKICGSRAHLSCGYWIGRWHYCLGVQKTRMYLGLYNHPLRYINSPKKKNA